MPLFNYLLYKEDGTMSQWQFEMVCVSQSAVLNPLNIILSSYRLSFRQESNYSSRRQQRLHSSLSRARMV